MLSARLAVQAATLAILLLPGCLHPEASPDAATPAEQTQANASTQQSIATDRHSALFTRPSTSKDGPAPAMPSFDRQGYADCQYPPAPPGVDQLAVVVRIQVDEKGRAVNTEVLQDPGYGAVQMAFDCALDGVHTPGTDDSGNPILAWTPAFTIRFVRGGR